MPLGLDARKFSWVKISTHTVVQVNLSCVCTSLIVKLKFSACYLYVIVTIVTQSPWLHMTHTPNPF